MKKRAFTLVEILLILIIIGTLITISLGIIKSRTNQYASTYYTAYSSLKKAAYNVLADMYYATPRNFPTTSTDLCLRLTEFINTSQTPTCTNGDINANASNVSDSTLRFVGTNAFKFYISGKQANIVVGGKTTEWFVVYVDLNGEKNPNSLQKVRNSMPDIVPFALTTRGEVLPMGYPTVSTQYLTAKVKYPNAYNSSAGKLIENRYSPSTSYFDARRKAWGSTETVDIIETIDFTSRLSSSNLARNFYTNPAAPAIQTTQVISDGYRAGCVAGEYTCRVIIDSFIGRRF